MNNLLQNRQKNNLGKAHVPVWFMRQAGRYHSHYQNIKKNSDFMTMCKTPELACEITMGPIQDFGFDAAILFSDLLFPLEHLGLGLSYHSGPPELKYHLRDEKNFKRLVPIQDGKSFYAFQHDALALLKKELPAEKTLLGFVGAPFTLFTYAVEGSHQGNLVDTKKYLYTDHYNQFLTALLPELYQSMACQAIGGADMICLFDTAAGELSMEDYRDYIVPGLKKLIANFKEEFPHIPIIYYSKMTHAHYLKHLEHSQISVLGVDWRHDLTLLKPFQANFYLQGNIDPAWLHLPWADLKKRLEQFKENLCDQNFDFSKWIFGLGHGVLINTPEENVRSTVAWVKENFTYTAL